MTPHRAQDLWEQLLKILDEKLQYGLLQQARAVSAVRLDGTELTLSVVTDEAFEFFSAHVNQQRLIIMARSVCAIEKIIVERLSTPSID